MASNSKEAVQSRHGLCEYFGPAARLSHKLKVLEKSESFS